MRGIADICPVQWIAKRKEVVEVCIKGKLELFALTETKMEENGEISCCVLSGSHA